MLRRVFASVLRCCARGPGDVRRAQPLHPPGTQVGDLARKHGERAAEVLGVPGAGHVGLAEADQAVVAEPGEELLRPVQHEVGAGVVPRRPGDARPRAGRAVTRAKSRRATGGRRSRAPSGPCAQGLSRSDQWSTVSGGGGRRGGHRTPSCTWAGGGSSGPDRQPRAQSQTPWTRISRPPQERAGCGPQRRRRCAGVPCSEASKTAPSSVTSRTADRSSVPGPGHDELVVAVDAVERGDVHLLADERPAVRRRGARGRRAGHRRCCAPRPPSRPGRRRRRGTRRR